jgi:deoxyribodipyrimidine photolyase
MKNVKINPMLKGVDLARDEKLDVFFSHTDWVEVNEEEWKRLKQMTHKLGEMKVSLLIADGEDWGEFKEVISEKEEPIEEAEEVFWEEDEVAEEE